LKKYSEMPRKELTHYEKDAYIGTRSYHTK